MKSKALSIFTALLLALFAVSASVRHAVSDLLVLLHSLLMASKKNKKLALTIT